ncbi:hypothetical protein WMF37_33390 [Sorangium sp. So ce291]|uniref:hypothetical protein n=1 Tax=Sorangium sp. So ce291 TaxID=3133294 RepID=UPI003F5F733E
MAKPDRLVGELGDGVVAHLVPAFGVSGVDRVKNGVEAFGQLFRVGHAKGNACVANDQVDAFMMKMQLDANGGIAPCSTSLVPRLERGRSGSPPGVAPCIATYSGRDP